MASGSKGDEYISGEYDDIEIGDLCCVTGGGCDQSPIGWCRTCESANGWDESISEQSDPDKAIPLCAAHLLEHCAEHQHTAWVLRAHEVTSYLEEEILELRKVPDTLNKIAIEVQALDQLRARRLLSQPEHDAEALAELESVCDEVATVADDIRQAGQSLRPLES